jgi:apolipoprotein N-acyltransferase
VKRGSIALGIGLSAATAALVTSAFPPYGLWPLIFLGFVPMLVAQHRILPERLSSIAPAIGVGGFVAGYVQGIFTPRAAWYMHLLPAIVALIVLVAGRGARRREARLGYHLFVPRWTFGWVSGELLRSYVPVLGTWAFLAYALYDQPRLLQPVSVFGIWGLGVLIMAVNASGALLAIAVLDRRRPPPDGVPVPLVSALRWCGAAAVALSAWIGLGALLLESPAPTLRAAAIQPGPVSRSNGREAYRRELLQKLVAGTEQAARQGAQLVVWPEGMIDFDLRVDSSSSARVRDLARATGTYLFVGSGIDTPLGHRNEVTGVGPDGTVLGVYGKDHPVLFTGETSITRGEYPVYPTPLGVLGSIICYDLDFTDTARRVSQAGAGLLAVPSRDWPAIAAKHYTHAVFRAIENRVAVIKAEYAFDSAIIDPYGRILARTVTPEGAAAVLVADLPVIGGASPLAGRTGAQTRPDLPVIGGASPPAGRTGAQTRPDLPVIGGGALTTRLGDAVGWLCVAASVALRLRSRRRLRAQTLGA